MAEYIERAVAINAIKKDVMGGLNYESILNRIPSEDVQPVKHGRWIDGDYRCVTAVCSKCKHLRLGNGAKFATRIALYCEHCGARMDGET